MYTQADKEEAFPWHLGVYDAHCHPTDTMSSMHELETMKTRILTVMATREEDQELVLAAAEEYGMQSSHPRQWTRKECIVPCFGWHPWFSHQMYLSDDETTLPTMQNPEKENKEKLTGEAKIKHYQAILQPARPDPSEEDRQLFLALPDPTPFSAFLSHTRKQLQRHPYALIGEIGLDRAFRIPEPWTLNPEPWRTRNTTLTLGGREGRRLTPFRTSPHHQRRIFQLQLQLAAAMGRAVSVHGVQAHGMLLDAMQELWTGHEQAVVPTGTRAASAPDAKPAPCPYPPRICLHSYSGNPSSFQQYLRPGIPARVFASFSTAINLAGAVGGTTPAAFAEMVRTVPDHMLLVESDLDRAGEELDARLEDMVRRLCEIKGWGLEDGVVRLGRNWRAFVFGGDGE